jgi:hypothetical protein
MKLITMSGNETKIQDIKKLQSLDDQQAGVYALYLIAKNNPGITFGQLIQGSGVRLSGWFTDLGRMVGNGLSDAINLIGKKTGESVRLFTDKEVVSGLQSYAAAAATGGESLAAQGLLSDLFGGKLDAGNLQEILGKLGKVVKGETQQAGIESGFGGLTQQQLLWVGGGVLGLLVLLMALKK